MLSKYWRSFPWYIQLIQFIVLFVVLYSFFGLAIGPFTLVSMGVSGQDVQNLSIASPRKVVDAALLYQLIFSTGIYLLPALLFAYFTHPRPAHYLGLRKPGKPIHWLLPSVIILSAAPLLIQLSQWISLMDLGSAARKTQETHERMTNALLTMHNPAQLLFTLLVLAVAPALSEEFFFRGIIMRFAAKRTYSVVLPIFISSVVFAYMHSTPYGLLSIFIDGVLLASFYYLTGSLWPGVIAHFANNGVQIVLSYFSSSGTLEQVTKSNSVPFSWILVGTPIAIGAFILLWKTRTPLKPYWTSDYDPEEIMEGTE